MNEQGPELQLSVDENILRGRGMNALEQLVEHGKNLAVREQQLQEQIKNAKASMDQSLAGMSEQQRAAVDQYIQQRDALNALHGERRGLKRAFSALNAMQQALVREYTRNKDLTKSNQELNHRLGEYAHRITRGDRWRR